MNLLNVLFIFTESNGSSMEFRHLQTFQSIVQEGSFLGAAEKLQYAQSTITLHIQQLETELGVKLFARQGKKVQLTAAGRSLQEHADYLLYRAVALQQAMTDLVAGEAGHLRIGSIEPTASLRLPPILVTFCREHPKVRLTLEVGITRVISQRVANGDLDLAICSLPAANLGVTFEPLFMDPMVLLLPEGHPLTNIDVIHVEALAGERLLVTEQNCPYREILEKALLPHGINPYSGLEIVSMEAIRRMIQGGLGIGLVPSVVVNPAPLGTVVKSVNGLNLELPVGIVRLPESSIPGLALDLLISALQNGLRNWSL